MTHKRSTPTSSEMPLDKLDKLETMKRIGDATKLVEERRE
jgi:hypothetical protein